MNLIACAISRWSLRIRAGFHGALAAVRGLAVLCVSVSVIAMVSGVAVSAQAAIPYRGGYVFEYGKGILSEYRHFVQIMGASGAAEAEANLACAVQANPTWSFGIFEIPVPPGASKPRLPLGIFVASYATKLEVQAAFEAATTTFNYAGTLSCLGVKPDQLKDATDLFKKDTIKVEFLVPPTQWKHSLGRTPLAAFDAVASWGGRSDSATRQALVEGKRYPSAQAVSAAIASYRGRYADVHFAAIKHGDFYYVAVTSLSSREGLAQATLAMRQRGAYELAVNATFSPVQTSLVTPTEVFMVDIRGVKVPFPDPKEGSGPALETFVLEQEDLFESVSARVTRCFQSATDKSQDTSIASMASCAGVVLTPRTLTRCLVDSDCKGMRVPVGFALPPRELVIRCLEIGGDLRNMPVEAACTATRLDPVFRSLLDKAGFAACFANGSKGAQCDKAEEVIAKACSSPENAAMCSSAQETLTEALNRARSVLKCLQGGACDIIVPRPPSVVATIDLELNRIKAITGQALDKGTALLLEAQALGGLADSANVVSRFKACADLRAKNDPTAETCFIKIGLSDQDAAVMDCFTKTGSDAQAQAACFVTTGQDKAALDKARCAKDAAGDPLQLAKCAGVDTSKVTQAYDCVATVASIGAVGSSCIPNVPPDMSAPIEY